MYAPPSFPFLLDAKLKLKDAVLPALQDEGLTVIAFHHLDSSRKALRVELRGNHATRSLTAHAVERKPRVDGLEEITFVCRRHTAEGEPYELMFKIAARPRGRFDAQGADGRGHYWHEEVYA